MGRDRGIAILEFVASMIMILLVLAGGVALWERNSALRRVQEIVDTSLAGIGTKPFKIENQAGELGINLNEDALELTVENIVNVIEVELDKIKASHGDYASEFTYYIEAAYAVLDIDPLTGESLGLSSSPYSFQDSLGNQNISNHGRSAEYLSNKFQSFSTRSFDSGRSIYAVPGRSLSQVEANSNYFDNSVMLGARVVIDTGESLIDSFLQLIEFDSVTPYSQVIVLRGEVE